MNNALIKLKLDGVMYHVTLMEQCIKNDLCGFAALNKHYAIEEFCSYLDLTKDYIKKAGIFPDVSSVQSPQIELDGTIAEEKIESCLSLYEKWEKSVLSQLRDFYNKSEDDKEILECLIEDVKKELYYIRRMYDDVAEGKAIELDEWLKKKWGD